MNNARKWRYIFASFFILLIVIIIILLFTLNKETVPLSTKPPPNEEYDKCDRIILSKSKYNNYNNIVIVCKIKISVSYHRYWK